MSASGFETDFLAGGGELGARLRAMDWSSTPLGPPAQWPRSLKTAVRIMLTSRQPIWIGWGSELTYLYNDPYKSIIGGKHPDALGRPTAEVWREIWSDVAPRLERVSANEGTYDEALLLIMERHGYREETYYTFSYSPMPDDDGRVGGVICFNTDDTPRVLRERQLALLARLSADTIEARTVADACALSAKSLATNPLDFPFAGIYMASPADGGMILRGAVGAEPGHPALPRSAAIDDATIWPFAEAMGTGHTIYVPRLENPPDPPPGGWDVATHHAVVVPISAFGREGSAGVLVAGLSPYRLFDDSYRESVELVSSQIAASIASSQSYEDEAKRAAALAEIDAAKTAFFSNVSHEFRTPLTLMLGPIEDALASPAHALEGESLDTTYRNSLRLLKLVNSLLDFSRIEAGRMQSRFEPTDLGAFTAEVASVFRSAVERAGLRFDVIAEPLSEPLYVDPEMWETIVLNLISNAFKFTFEGEIVVRVRATGEGAILTVSDTGVGIPAGEVPRLFERFHRIETAKARTYEGSGIGLALVQQLVQMHGGKIQAESTVGRGTTISVTIPGGTSHLPQERVATTRSGSRSKTRRAAFAAEIDRWLARDGAATSEEPAEPDRSAPHARILVVDDNADMRDYLARLLRQHWSVDTVTNGNEALAVMREQRFDLILTDVMMPERDGFSLLQEIRKDPTRSHTPVIMLSGRAGEESRVEGLAAGADDYIVKPFSARELIARVATHLQIGLLRREAELQREHLYSLFMQAPMPIVILRGDEHVIELANRSACEVWGRRHEDVIEKSLFDALPETRGTVLEELLDDVLHQGRVHVGKELLVKLDRFHDGSLHDTYFNFVYTPLRTVEGTNAGVLVTAADVTDEVVARQNMNELRARAEEANRTKDEFLAMLGHELRTPLTAILGWSRMLRMGLLETEGIDEAIDAIERAARNQTQLIEDLLDVSRIVSGKLRLEVQPVDLTEVIQAAISTVKPAANANEIRLQVTLDPNAAPVAGDPDRLQQVVWNLLSNAVKFSPKGGRVQVRLARVESSVELTVSDTGRGIPAEFLPHVFEPFRQAEGTTTRSHGGLGLGLSIVRSLIELHGGTVEAQSEGAGKGASFVVRLPVMAVQSGTARPATTAPARDRSSAAEVPFECPAELKGCRVLVVDDDAETRRLLISIISRCEAEVTAAPTVRDALELLARGGFDVLVSDIEMAGEDGYTLIRNVRERGDRIPSAALTAHARSEDQMRALRAGFDMHVAKPVEPGELVTVIASLRRRSAPPA